MITKIHSPRTSFRGITENRTISNGLLKFCDSKIESSKIIALSIFIQIITL